MLSDDGAKVVHAILLELNSGIRALPTEISLAHLEDVTGVRAQNIGMAFSGFINKPLLAKGILSRKLGTPRRLMLERLTMEEIQ